MFQVFQFQLFYPDVTYVAMAIHVCFKRIFHCFKLMSQVFSYECCKVDLDVAYVAMAIHTCVKLCFKCFICFRCMLQIFYLDVLKVDLR
jgi:hypothetical protein